MSCTKTSNGVPDAASAFATDSVEGQRACPSGVIRFDLLKVVGSSPAFLARPEAEGRRSLTRFPPLRRCPPGALAAEGHSRHRHRSHHQHCSAVAMMGIHPRSRLRIHHPQVAEVAAHCSQLWPFAAAPGASARVPEATPGRCRCRCWGCRQFLPDQDEAPTLYPEKPLLPLRRYWGDRFPAIVVAVKALAVRTCTIDARCPPV
jgi:hypothetical protein